MAAKNILMIVGDFVEDYEVMVPFQMLLMVGHNVHTVCPGKKSGEKVKTAVHDFIGDQTYAEFPGHLFTLNFDFDKVEAEKYDALVLPGGRAPEYLRLNPKVLEITKHFADNNKPLAAICHGPLILAAAKVLGDKEVIPYPAVGPDCVNSGACLGTINDTFSNAVVSGNLVTAPAWPAHPEWLRKFLVLLGTKIEL